MSFLDIQPSMNNEYLVDEIRGRDNSFLDTLSMFENAVAKQINDITFYTPSAMIIGFDGSCAQTSDARLSTTTTSRKRSQASASSSYPHESYFGTYSNSSSSAAATAGIAGTEHNRRLSGSSDESEQLDEEGELIDSSAEFDDGDGGEEMEGEVDVDDAVDDDVDDEDDDNDDDASSHTLERNGAIDFASPARGNSRSTQDGDECADISTHEFSYERQQSVERHGEERQDSQEYNSFIEDSEMDIMAAEVGTLDDSTDSAGTFSRRV